MTRRCYTWNLQNYSLQKYDIHASEFNQYLHYMSTPLADVSLISFSQKTEFVRTTFEKLLLKTEIEVQCQ